MATVRFSDELRAMIEKNARELFDKRIQNAKDIGKDWPWIVAVDYIQTVNNLLGNVPQVIRDKFISYGRTFKIKEFKCGNKSINPVGNAIDVGMEVDVAFPMPHKESDTVAKQLGFVKYKRGYSYDFTVVLDGDDPKWADLCSKAIERNETIHKIEEERNRFVVNVRHIINTYSTLAPALKAWPPLWDLVPSNKQAKHKEIVDRKRIAVEDVVSGMNLDQMTAMTVASKLRK